MILRQTITALMLLIGSYIYAAIPLTESERQQLLGYELIAERVSYGLGTTATGYTQVFYNMATNPLRINLYAKPFGTSFLYKALVIDNRTNYKFRGIVNLSRNTDGFIPGINDREPFSGTEEIDMSNMDLKGTYLKSCVLWVNSPL